MQVEVMEGRVPLLEVRTKRMLPLLLLPLILSALRWPLGNGNEPRIILQSYGQLQGYGPDAFLHTGIDILGSEWEAVYAASPGIVKKWHDSGYGSYLGIADYDTADSCYGWIYGHLDPERYHKEVGEWVETGELIGYLFSMYGFSHLHWTRAFDFGPTWGQDWYTADNPWLYLEPKGDTIGPCFVNARDNQLFGFKVNHADSLLPYLEPGSLYGDVDVIARIRDQTGYYSDDWDTSRNLLIPMEVWYEIHGEVSTRPIRSFLFAGVLQYRTNLDVWYTFDTTCHGCFNLTNTDGDSLREESDHDSCWHTADFPDGAYWVVVTARDAAGNTSVDSMQIRLCNGVEFDEYEIRFSLLSPFIRAGEPLKILCQAPGVLKVYDVSGRRWLEAQLWPSTYFQEIELGNLPVGVYFIRIDRIDLLTSYSLKFVVIR